jgi:membrane-associated protein
MVYNIIGGFLWVTLLTFAGYFFGGLEIIKKNFELAVFAIIIISLLPAIFEYLKHKFGQKSQTVKPEKATYEEIQKTFKKEHLKD